MIVRERDLGRRTYLTKGGFAEIYRVEGFTLPGDPTPLAYKKYTVDAGQQARSATACVDFRDRLSPADRADLDEFCTWPRALVHEDSGAVAGLLMPLLPAQFFCSLQGDTGQMTSAPREMSWLATSAAQRRAAHVDLGDVDLTERLVLLAKLVYAIGRLHRHGWVFGDISFRNAVFALGPPRVKLVDCDGAAPLADVHRKQSSTPFWDAPECPLKPPPGQRRQQDLQDDVTDAYKLGLAILRCLTPGKGAAADKNPGRLGGELDGTGTDLVRRALSDDRSARPAARLLYAYLANAVVARTAVPEVRLVRLTTPFLVRGQDARIEWRIEHAAEIEITYGNGRSLTIDPALHRNGYAFRADESGPVVVEARNRFGTARADLGEVTLYELPSFSVNVDFLPRPRIPEITAFSPPDLAATLEGRPRVPVGTGVVTVPSLGTFELVDTLTPAGTTAVPWPGIEAAVRESAGVVADVIIGEGNDLAARLRDVLMKEAA